MRDPETMWIEYTWGREQLLAEATAARLAHLAALPRRGCRTRRVRWFVSSILASIAAVLRRLLYPTRNRWPNNTL